jgi:tRNA threonylcarbamoyladenosine biosynthesis protein TsaB
MEQGRLLVPLVDRVITSAGWDKRRDIDLITVSRGPGSYTGLRVGITCAKTLAALLNKPLVGVCSLDAMAENAPAEIGTVLAAVDAKRGQVYAAVYQRAQGTLRRTLDPAVLSPVEALNFAAHSPAVYVMGDAARRYASDFAIPGCTLAPEKEWRIRASVIARIGLALFRAGQSAEPADLEPSYLRLAEAEERRQLAAAQQLSQRSLTRKNAKEST